MSVPALPHWQPQGPDSRCVLQGHQLGWENCTPTSVAMAVERSTLSALRPSGCEVRDFTGDYIGGTTLPQCVKYAAAHNIHVDTYVGPNVVSPFYVGTQIRAGRSGVLQGNTEALLSTSHRSTGGRVNHAVYVAAVRGGSGGEPDAALVYDPAADGRVAGWGKAAQGPQWWPWLTVKKFAASLRPSSTDGGLTGTVLGPGKCYVALFPDTEPHAHFRYGGSRTTPFPDRTRVDVTALWSHRTPAYGTTNRISPRLERDGLFVAYQRVVKSGVLWLGSHDGTRWVPASKMRNVGGSQ